MNTKKLIRNFGEGLLVIVPVFIVFIIIREFHYFITSFLGFLNAIPLLAFLISIAIFIALTTLIGILAENRVKNFIKQKINSFVSDIAKGFLFNKK